MSHEDVHTLSFCKKHAICNDSLICSPSMLFYLMTGSSTSCEADAKLSAEVQFKDALLY